MILSLCTSKLILSIFFGGPFVFAQFWDITLIISWSVKKLIFLMKILKMADFVSVISPWKQNPRSKFGGLKCTSWTGKHDGLKTKYQRSYPWAKFGLQNWAFLVFSKILLCYRSPTRNPGQPLWAKQARLTWILRWDSV